MHLDLAPLGLGRHAIDDARQRGQVAGQLVERIKYQEREERLATAHRICEIAGIAPPRLMMTPEQLRRMHAAGMEIGAHTVNHPILANCDDELARREIAESKRTLESVLGAPVRFFAYPNGKPGQDYQARHVAMVRELGFDAALTTAIGAARAGADPFQIPRSTPWRDDALGFLGPLVARRLQRSYATA